MVQLPRELEKEFEQGESTLERFGENFVYCLPNRGRGRSDFMLVRSPSARRGSMVAYEGDEATITCDDGKAASRRTNESGCAKSFLQTSPNAVPQTATA